ncbi:hypothetical protein P4O66_003355 [Electrophorus voltai]|uniref:Uncharacterized protein n=1 Tax=Electrophorus voltai TaxID=2609070 RepID=A0AAD8YQ22_9TELE|nr:hypothetical protein P4O66_003355 [Electrophorus voltai]
MQHELPQTARGLDSAESYRPEPDHSEVDSTGSYDPYMDYYKSYVDYGARWECSNVILRSDLGFDYVEDPPMEVEEVLYGDPPTDSEVKSADSRSEEPPLPKRPPKAPPRRCLSEAGKPFCVAQREEETPSTRAYSFGTCAPVPKPRRSKGEATPGLTPETGKVTVASPETGAQKSPPPRLVKAHPPQVGRTPGSRRLGDRPGLLPAYLDSLLTLCVILYLFLSLSVHITLSVPATLSPFVSVPVLVSVSVPVSVVILVPVLLPSVLLALAHVGLLCPPASPFGVGFGACLGHVKFSKDNIKVYNISFNRWYDTQASSSAVQEKDGKQSIMKHRCNRHDIRESAPGTSWGCPECSIRSDSVESYRPSMDYQNWYDGDQFPGSDSAESYYPYWDYREEYGDYEQSEEYQDVSLRSDSEVDRLEDPVVEVEDALHEDSPSVTDTWSADSESDEPPASKARPPPKACRTRVSELPHVTHREVAPSSEDTPSPKAHSPRARVPMRKPQGYKKEASPVPAPETGKQLVCFLRCLLQSQRSCRHPTRQRAMPHSRVGLRPSRQLGDRLGFLPASPNIITGFCLILFMYPSQSHIMCLSLCLPLCLCLYPSVCPFLCLLSSSCLSSSPLPCSCWPVSGRSVLRPRQGVYV